MIKHGTNILIIVVVILTVLATHYLNSGNKEAIQALVGSELTLGEKTIIITETSHFEIELKNVRYNSRAHHTKPYTTSKNGVFITLDIGVTNLSDDPLTMDFLSNSSIRVKRHTSPNLKSFSTLNGLWGRLDSGKTYKGQLVFDYIASDVYELTLGEDDVRSTTWVFEGHVLTQKANLLRISTLLTIIGVIALALMSLRYYRHRYKTKTG